MQLIAEQGLDAVPELIRIVINHAMHAQRSQYLHAELYERTAERRGYANGYKPKPVTTRIGKVAFAVPQVRDSNFYPQALEKGLRSERALTLALAEQRCQFHLQQNAQAYVPRQELKAEVAADIRAIFTAPTRADADSLLARTVQKYAKGASKLATWLETAIPEGLTVFALSAAHRTRLRTRVVGIFPNEAACLRLVTALAMETSDEWEAGKVYLAVTD